MDGLLVSKLELLFGQHVWVSGHPTGSMRA